MMKNYLLFTVILCCQHCLFAQNTGIGTTNPQEKLDVNGGVRIGYSASPNSAGTVRFSNGEMEYNTGFAWRSLVNSFKDSSISSLTPFVSTVRNTWVEIPVSMTVTEPGVYLVIYKANGYNNSVYFPGSGNADNQGLVNFTPVRMAVSRGQRLQRKCQETQRNYFFASLAFLHPLLLCNFSVFHARPNGSQPGGQRLQRKCQETQRNCFSLKSF